MHQLLYRITGGPLFSPLPAGEGQGEGRPSSSSLSRGERGIRQACDDRVVAGRSTWR
jgi:hypothetical protein